MSQNGVLKDLSFHTSEAVRYYWLTRSHQQSKQKQGGKVDQGSRSEVTGGAHMNGFIDLFIDLAKKSGISEQSIFRKKAVVQLPGFFRPTKEWDLLIVQERMLIGAIEVKSQAGPSFGNNLNNRTEEAMGSALDFWTAFREGAYLKSPQPFLGYFFMLEDCEESNTPVRVKEPHFPVFPEFIGASYLRRYELFCRKLVLERQYSASAFITSSAKDGPDGIYHTPAEDLSVERFAKVFISHVAAFV